MKFHYKNISNSKTPSDDESDFERFCRQILEPTFFGFKIFKNTDFKVADNEKKNTAFKICERKSLMTENFGEGTKNKIEF